MGIREKLMASLGREPSYDELHAAKEQKKASKQPWTASSSGEPPAVDWSCSACGAKCFASKTSCFKCGMGKDGIMSPTSKKHKRREGIYKSQAGPAECQDKTLTCRICATEFVFTAGEQAYFQKQGYIGSERARCPECARTKKRKVEEGKPTCGGRLICFDWKKGSCARGDGCKFAHGEPDGVLGEDDAAVCGGGRSPPKAAAAKPQVLRCFHCNAEGHRVSECPKAKAWQEAQQMLHGGGKKAAAKAADSKQPATPEKKKKKKKRNRNGTLPTANKAA